MKVTTHSLPGHTGEQELTTVSVQDIKVKNGPVQRRNGHCMPALNRSYESQSGGGSVVVNDPHVLQKRRRRCTDTLCEVKSTPEESLLEEGDAVRCSASVGDDFRSIDGTCFLHATDGAHSQQLTETGKVGSGLNKSVCSCSCGTDHCEGCALSADSTASDVCASGFDSKLLTRCEWDNCSSCELDAEALLEHIRTVHVATQNKQVTATNSGVVDDEPSYVCLWAGCKVYNKASCLLTWLERHIQGHVGAKPHRCIVAGCGARFASQLMLERHVNGHFAMSASPSISALRPSRKGDANSKLSKKRKLKFLRPCPVKVNDYFDSCIMESIREDLIRCAEESSLLSDETISGNTVTFQRSIIARRFTSRGQPEVLLHWKPADVLPDEWLLESDAASVTSRTLPLSCLPCDIVYEMFSLPRPTAKHFHRHRRK